MNYYRPQISCGQGNVFTGVCLSKGVRVSASVHAVMPYPPPGTRQIPPGPGKPPRSGRPPGSGRPPPDQADPPGPGRHPPWSRQTPPGPGRHMQPPGPGRHPWGPGRHHPQTRHPPGPGNPPRKQTPAYGLRAAGTHPTGMHSCFQESLHTKTHLFSQTKLST